MLDDSRAVVAEALHAQPDEIVFTSGGTESVALAIWGGVREVTELEGSLHRRGDVETRPSGASATSAGARRI